MNNTSTFAHRSSGRRHREAGIAIILILAFIVILTGLVFAFFSRALTERQVANSSLNQSKADILARSATDVILGDFKQEIVNGSIPSTPAPGVTIYQPKSSINMLPKTSGTPAPVVNPSPSPATLPIPNLIRRSVRNDPLAQGTTKAVSTSASAVNSTSDPAANNRSVTLARWNSHYLIPRDPALYSGTNANTIGTDPVPSFTPPDWVVVTTSGPKVLTAPDPTAIGRYAYAIYDEGGLLDINVAGYPSQITPKQAAYKSSQAFVDLSTLPSPIPNTPVGTSQMDQIVAWRNYATISLPQGYPSPGPAPSPPSGVFPNYNVSLQNSSNYWLASLSSTFGNLRISPSTYPSPIPANGAARTDQIFTSRQALLSFRRASKFTQDALQYLTTTSRDLNQPSFTPSASRPKILGNGTVNGGPMAGGNDAYQNPPVDDKINPSFLTTRIVAGGWLRNDGSMATAGEPIVKKRFALNRLAWLTYEGPSKTASVATKTALSNGGISQAIIDQGTDEAIQKYFGLSWDNSLKRWKYVHGISAGTGRIMTIAETDNIGKREPDFFELLKASIAVGSLGKAYSFTSVNPDPTIPAGYQQQKDNSVDAQVIQMGANIIDQFDFDGYPTRIVFTDLSLFGGAPQEYRGIEDLPYLYRVREGKITLRDSVPTQSNLPTISTTSPTDPGLCAVLQEPEVWNPHGWSSSALDTNPRPTSLRLVAISTDPNSPSSSAEKISVGRSCLVWSGSSYGGALPSTNLGPVSPGPAWNETTTEIDFGVPTNKLYLYREPTLLIKPGIPDSSVQIGAGNVLKTVQGSNYLTSQWPATQLQGNGVTDNKQYIGILAGYGPVAWPATVPQQGIDENNPAMAALGVVEATSAYLPTAIKGITYRLQYLDSFGQWQTYDEKFADYVAAGSYNNGAFWTDQNKTFNSYNGTTQDNIIGTELGVACMDPRTNRFGMQFIGTNGYRGSGSSQFPLRQNIPRIGWAAGTDTSGSAFKGAISQLALATMRPDDNAGFSYGGGGVAFLATGATAPGWYPDSNASTIIQPGMFSQNNPAEVKDPSNKVQVSLDGQTVGGSLNQYFADADGVVRRGMSSYVPTDSTNPATPASGGKPSGLPLKTSFDYSKSTPAANVEIANRPIVLNRPFRSPAELSVVFSGTPWRNLDLSTPESGAVALADVFSTNDTDDYNGLVAGKVNLNTRQNRVLQTMITGAYKDELNPTGTTLTAAEAVNIVNALTARTSSSAADKGPLTNVSELAGKWNSTVAVATSVDGSKSYVGFSDAELSTAFGSAGERIARFREAATRVLVGSGQTRVWNLMIDLVAQTGRFPTTAANAPNPLAAFVVEGEQRYWVHLAIDRYTGQIIDKQIEVVRE